ncbi:hypothetical protein HHI36_016696 [Cryptolaemus montrouzieri]|uniref:G protein gamma domain-containing protein n=1 Tax=Cryptolaemus montrouzieri TaxID=559131 RepID=A0ABD2NKJ1_9CUCU
MEKQNKELIKKYQRQEQINQELREEIEILRQDQQKLKDAIKTTSHKTNLTDQEHLENDVIISGIAEDDLKNPNDEKKIVVKIAKFCDVDINEADMEKCYQIGNNGKKQIKLVFRDKEKKELFMSKRK